MGRVFFPTYSLNRWGVRDTNQQATLGAAIERFPAEPNPRAAQNPTPPILGSVGLVPETYRYGTALPIYRPPIPVRVTAPPVAPIVESPPPVIRPVGPVGPAQYPVTGWPAPSGPAYPVTPSPIISSSGGGGQVLPAPAPPAPTPVSAQPGPTPTVNVPPPAPTGAVLVSSGGGTQVPATSTVVAAAPATSTDFVSGIASWLGGSTPIFNYNVPNALLAGVVVLGFAFLSSGSGKKR